MTQDTQTPAPSVGTDALREALAREVFIGEWRRGDGQEVAASIWANPNALAQPHLEPGVETQRASCYRRADRILHLLAALTPTEQPVSGAYKSVGTDALRERISAAMHAVRMEYKREHREPDVADFLPAILANLTTARAPLEVERVRLGPWLRHHDNCTARHGEVHLACDCGLHAALAALASASPAAPQPQGDEPTAEWMIEWVRREVLSSTTLDLAHTREAIVRALGQALTILERVAPQEPQGEREQLLGELDALNQWRDYAGFALYDNRSYGWHAVLSWYEYPNGRDDYYRTGERKHTYASGTSRSSMEGALAAALAQLPAEREPFPHTALAAAPVDAHAETTRCSKCNNTGFAKYSDEIGYDYVDVCDKHPVRAPTAHAETPEESACAGCGSKVFGAVQGEELEACAGCGRRRVKAVRSDTPESMVRHHGVLAVWETEDGFAYAWNRIPGEGEDADAGDFCTLDELLASLRAPTAHAETPEVEG